MPVNDALQLSHVYSIIITPLKYIINVSLVNYAGNVIIKLYNISFVPICIKTHTEFLDWSDSSESTPDLCWYHHVRGRDQSETHSFALGNLDNVSITKYFCTSARNWALCKVEQ